MVLGPFFYDKAWTPQRWGREIRTVGKSSHMPTVQGQDYITDSEKMSQVHSSSKNIGEGTNS